MLLLVKLLMLTLYLLPMWMARQSILWHYTVQDCGDLCGIPFSNDDKNTVYGADFSHQGETPGLGAEITKPAFSGQFAGKQIFKDSTFKSIAVVKHGKTAEGQDYVDGISGGTITSQGVSKMLFDSLKGYEKFFNFKRVRRKWDYYLKRIKKF